MSHDLSPSPTFFVTQAVQPIPDDLTQRWEDYHFMLLYESAVNVVAQRLMPVHVLSPQALCALQTEMSSLSLISPADCRQFLAQSPEFVPIFQAGWLLHFHELVVPHYHFNFHYIRRLLDLSCNDIMAALVALRSLVGGATGKQLTAALITVFVLSLEFYPASATSLTSDLIHGWLRLIQQLDADDLPRFMYVEIITCGFC
jgi:hypothetical protein